MKQNHSFKKIVQKHAKDATVKIINTTGVINRIR